MQSTIGDRKEFLSGVAMGGYVYNEHAEICSWASEHELNGVEKESWIGVQVFNIVEFGQHAPELVACFQDAIKQWKLGEPLPGSFEHDDV